MNKREWMLQAALMWIRAGHGGASDEVATVLSGTYDAVCAASPETPQEGAWVEHDGDVSKAPPERVEVLAIYRNGDVVPGTAGEFAWDHDGDGADIVRWRYA